MLDTRRDDAPAAALARRTSLEWFKWSDRTPEFVDRWQILSSRSVPGKAYLSPSFLTPALTHLNPQANPWVVVGRGNRNDFDLIGFLEPRGGSWRTPFAHLRAVKTIHSFMSGIIVEPMTEPAAVEQLFLQAAERGYHAIEMLYRLAQTPTWGLLEQAAHRAGFQWVEFKRFDRAVLFPAENVDIESAMTSKRRKAYRSAMRGLKEIGPVEYRVVCEPDDLIAAGERFLDLEDKGWKKERGVSLKSHEPEAQFFREMFAGFAFARKARVCELSVAGRIVASTIHLISGDTSFAFKLGWDPEFAKYKVGICQQVLTAIHAARDFGDVEVIDSCTEGDSFFEKLWPGRRTIVSGSYVRQGWRRSLVVGLLNLRRMKSLFAKTCPNARQDGDPCGH